MALVPGSWFSWAKTGPYSCLSISPVPFLFTGDSLQRTLFPECVKSFPECPCIQNMSRCGFREEANVSLGLCCSASLSVFFRKAMFTMQKRKLPQDTPVHHNNLYRMAIIWISLCAECLVPSVLTGFMVYYPYHHYIYIYNIIIIIIITSIRIIISISLSLHSHIRNDHYPLLISRPEDGFRCRQGVKPRLKLKISPNYDLIMISWNLSVNITCRSDEYNAFRRKPRTPPPPSRHNTCIRTCPYMEPFLPALRFPRGNVTCLPFLTPRSSYFG